MSKVSKHFEEAYVSLKVDDQVVKRNLRSVTCRLNDVVIDSLDSIAKKMECSRSVVIEEILSNAIYDIAPVVDLVVDENGRLSEKKEVVEEN